MEFSILLERKEVFPYGFYGNLNTIACDVGNMARKN